MPTSAHRTDGFTLVEVLIALTLLALISVLIGQALQGALRAHDLQNREPEHLRNRAETLARQFAGELEEPAVTLEPVPEAESGRPQD
jgi:prepilin-type N-terminal cleavage/methylation domain-containing protein